VHNKAKIQPAVRIDIRAFPKPKRQEEVCKDVANVMSPFVLANTMLPARTTMEEATFLLCVQVRCKKRLAGIAQTA
jgi:hypothetical protein